MKVLVTGNAGFIGFHVASALLARGDDVVGFDVVNDYYDPSLKEARLAILKRAGENARGRYEFIRADVAGQAAVDDCFERHRPDCVVHLAAQAGIRHSIENPRAYVASNLVGFANVIEACRRFPVRHLVYASTSSVYGANARLPFSETHGVDHPLQFYAVTKRSNELSAHAYSHLFGLPTTGLRFFTVYGPWGRPDMALFQFTRNIIAGRPIRLFNHGEHTRDFTYVDDVVRAVLLVVDRPPTSEPGWRPDDPDPSRSSAPFRIFNIGAGTPVPLRDYVDAIEAAVGTTAQCELVAAQPGDIHATHADVGEFERTFGFRPCVSVREGVAKFVQWYRAYYGV
jgi:UDP-glucuronate 4-epimerase